jgi:fluoride exporter
MSKLLWVIIGGGAGAGLRYLIAGSEWLRLDSGFPLGTFFVNLLGCFAIGLIWQQAQNSSILSPLLVIGFLGGFTTFSSFGLETYQLFTNANYKMLTAYVLLSNILGFALVYLGHYLSSTFNLNNV